MLSTLLMVFAAMLIIVSMMAIGVLFGRKPISGSCGGMAALGMETECDICGGNKDKCDSELKQPRKRTSLAYDAVNR